MTKTILKTLEGLPEIQLTIVFDAIENSVEKPSSEFAFANVAIHGYD